MAAIPRNVQTTLSYYDDPGDGTPPTPVFIGKGTVTNERKAAVVPVTVHDVTGRESDGTFTLDTCGFQFVRHTSQAARCEADGFRDMATITSDYFPDCADVLKQVTGARRVFVFDPAVRRGPSDWHKLGPGNASKRGPLHRVHVDQSYAGAAFTLKWYLGDEAEQLMATRWQIINVWRPIKEIFKDPLAVVDARTVAEEDLVEARVVYPDHERPTWTVKPPRQKDGHTWHYKYRQTPEEVTLIKCFDSIDDGTVARRVPHSAFRDDAYDDASPRESIEVRAFVFYD